MSESIIPTGNTAMAAPRYEYDILGTKDDEEGDGENVKQKITWGQPKKKEDKPAAPSFSNLMEADAKKTEAEKEQPKELYRPNMHRGQDDGFSRPPERVSSYDFGRSGGDHGIRIGRTWSNDTRGSRSGYDYAEEDTYRHYGGGRGSYNRTNEFYATEEDEPTRHTPVLALGGQSASRPDFHAGRGPVAPQLGGGVQCPRPVLGGENARATWGFDRQVPQQTQFTLGGAVQPPAPGAQPAQQQQVPTRDWRP